ncbi:MAG: hypothetical protein N2110_06505 [Flavobacteriales bacterium]|nr:hypothetical protein [Flavobacteriales bacterium]
MKKWLHLSLRVHHHPTLPFASLYFENNILTLPSRSDQRASQLPIFGYENFPQQISPLASEDISSMAQQILRAELDSPQYLP